MFSTENSTVDPAQERDATQVNLTNSLDDEYSPGVFQVSWASASLAEVCVSWLAKHVTISLELDITC